MGGREEMLADDKLFPATGTYNAMLNCLAKNAAVGGATMEDGRELMLAALERGKTWDEQVPEPQSSQQTLISKPHGFTCHPQTRNPKH